MSEFTSELIVSPLPDGKRWVVRKAFKYFIGEEGSDEYVEVPVGFITDFASIPRLFWLMLPKWGKYGNAAVVHDYLYFDQRKSRKQSDEIFLEAMEVLEVSRRTRKTMLRAVRWFGGKSWEQNKQISHIDKFALLTGEYERIEKVVI